MLDELAPTLAGKDAEGMVAAFIEGSVAISRRHPIVAKAVRDELDMLGPVLVETGDGYSFVKFVADRLAVQFDKHLPTGTPDVPTKQLAEAAVRVAISLVLVPSSEFEDHRAIARLLVHGAAAQPTPPHEAAAGRAPRARGRRRQE